MREQSARYACEEGSQTEGYELVLGYVETYRLGGYAVVAYRHYRSSRPRAHEVVYHYQRENEQHEAYDEGGVLGRARDAQSTVYHHFAVGFEPQVALAGKRDMKSSAVIAYIERRKDVLYYLTERERYDSEVVAAQTEHGYTDQHAEKRRKQTADEQRKRESYPRARDSILYGTGEYRSYAHEPCLSEAELAEYAYREVERHGGYGVYAEGHQKTLEHIACVSRGNEYLYCDERGCDYTVCHELSA